MPSVASEPNAVLPPRTPLSSARNQPDSRDAATPFADLLDSAGPANEPPPRDTRSDRAERSDRTDRPDRSDRTDTSAAKDDRRTADAASARDNGDAQGNQAAKDSKAASDSKDAKDSADAKAAKDADKSAKEAADTDAAAVADATIKGAPDAGKAAAPDAAIVNAAPVLTIPPPPVAMADAAAAGDEAEEALAALQAAGQQTAPKAAPKAPASPGDAHGDVDGDAKAKGKTAADPQTAVPPVDAGKDQQARGKTDAAAGDIEHASTLIKKFDIDAHAQGRGDTASAAKTADAVQNLGIQAQAGQSAATTAAHQAAAVAPPAPAQIAAAVPLASLAIEIATQAHDGKRHFEIRLDPPELGRIDVKLDVDRDGNITTKVMADRSDTLDLLKRDAAQLERALQQSGLKTSDNALEFSLRQQGFAHDDTPAQNAANIAVSDDDPAPLEALRQGYGRLLGLGGGLDIRV